MVSHFPFIRLLLQFCCACLFLSTQLEAIHWDPLSYNANSEPEWSYAMSLFQRITLKGDEQVLDLGCGDGKVASTIAYRVPRGKIIGVDVSKKMVSYATQRYGNNSYGNISYKAMDANELQFNSGEFDLVFSSWALQWIQDQSAVIQNVADVLKPRGHFAFSVPLNLPSALEQATQLMVDAPEWAEYFCNFESPLHYTCPEEYVQELISNGFTLKRVEVLLTKAHRFRGKGGLKKHLEQWFPYLDPIPDDKKELFLDTLLESYNALVEKDENSQHFERLEIEAVKAESSLMIPFRLTNNTHRDATIALPSAQAPQE